MFPIGDRAGRIIAFGGRTLGDGQPKYLNSPDTPVFEKGRILYGWAAARANIAREPDGAAVIVVEGYMDVIALHRAGFGGAVAPLGTALTEMQLHELWRLAPEPVLCFDGDAAGQRAALRALARALPLLAAGPQPAFRRAARRRGPGFADPRRRARRLLADPRGCLSAVRDAVAAELNAGAIDTPERRADLERRVMAQAGLIADRTVQNEYRRFFRDRLFALGETGPARLRDLPGRRPRRAHRTIAAGGRGRAAAAAAVRPAQPRDSSSASLSRTRR